MREALNSNPIVQIGVIAVLLVAVGLFMMMNLHKGSSSSSTSTTSAPTPATSSSSVVGASAVPASPEVSSASVAGAPPAAGGVGLAAAGAAVTPESLIPGPGLPRPVIKAWKGGDAVALLIVRGSGIDDRLVRGSVRSLSENAGVAVFVAKAQDIARYARIT